MSKPRLLLADDSLTIQKVVNLTFADQGIEVVTANDGDQAMQKFVEAVPDLVMVDVSIPGLDGYRFCEFIKGDDETKTIPVILLVGSFEPFDEEEARRVGADDFLTKPFQSIRQLADKVSALLDAKIAEDNFLRPIENRDAPVGAFAEDFETTPDDEFDSADEPTENLGDAGMDDEMIQTAQIGSLPVDEIRKFESEPIDESYTENIDSADAEPSAAYESLTDELEEEYWAKTEVSSAADLEKNADVSSRENTAASGLNFDELDLLDFPQATNKEDFSEIAPSIDSEISNEATPQLISDTPTDTPIAAELKTSGVSTGAENLSPESIEAIADRVVEKLSNKVVERIVTEVLSQMERKR